MLAEALALLLLTLLLLVYVFQWFRSSRGLPPGPPRYPLVGCTPSFMGSSEIHKTMADMAKQYGDVFTVYMPFKPTIVINSYKAAHDALVMQKDKFSGRPYQLIGHIITRGGKGLGFSDFNSNMLLTRKIAHSAIRLYQPHLEGKIVEEAEKLAKRLQKHDCQPFDPKMDFSLAVVNVIYSILFGIEHHGVDDPQFVDHVESTEHAHHLLAPTNILNIFPWLIHFPTSETKILKDLLEKRAVVIDAPYFKIKNSFQENQMRHLLDALLQAKLEEEKSDVMAHDAIDDDDVMATCHALIGAGTDTVSTTLDWLLAYLLHFSNIQERLHEEIKEVFGCDGKVQLKNRKSCHYLEATLTEVLRCSSLAPLFVHKTTCDTTLSGYHIPKDTTVLLNIWAINHDEREWENPEEFNPDRFLDSEGHFTGTTKMSYMPFGAGRRVCLGESLAKAELFLTSATLLQKFKFENPPGCPLPDLKDGTPGFTYTPKPYKVIAKER